MQQRNLLRAPVLAGLAAGMAMAVHGSSAGAVPGPDSVAVLSNSTVPESVALGQRYATARNIPSAQVCPVAVPDQDAITLDEFRTMVLAPLETCLTHNGVIDRIEAVVLTRGIPIRVMVPDGTAMQSVSLAAALGVWHSRTTTGGMPLLGQPPGMTANCGSPCYAARWHNPYVTGAFDATWTATLAGIEWHPLLVTMLNARSYTDAALLITSAIDAERMGGARGHFLLMNGADSARGVLDTQYDGVIQMLQTHGFTDSARVPFDSNLTGQRLAAFFTGTASLGMTIEGNTFLPGSIVDNLTSFGADPVNFHATGENQVSIARFVAAGASGAHGTVDEPLNNVFPSRYVVVDYANGFTLAEAYMRSLPFTYWRNLVLGDPMLAPYATRPTVVVTGVQDGQTHAGAIRIAAQASESHGHPIASTALYVDGVQVARADTDHVETCYVPTTPGPHAVLAVAQLADDATSDGPRSKGWTALGYTSTAGAASCDVAVDAGTTPDGGARGDGGGLDGGTGRMPGGCGCTVPEHSRHSRGATFALVLAAGLATRRRRSV